MSKNIEEKIKMKKKISNMIKMLEKNFVQKKIL